MNSSVDTFDMLLIHRVLVREFGRLPALIRGAAGDAPRARTVAGYVTEILDFVHVHHGGEDELLYPLLRRRVTLDAELIDRMEDQHAQVSFAVDAVRQQVPAWAGTADIAAGERMATLLESIDDVFRTHIEEEEAQILPLASEHLSQAEWDALGKHGLSSTPPKRRLLTLARILDETTDAERLQFLRSIPPPIRLAYKVIGRRQYARELVEIRS